MSSPASSTRPELRDSRRLTGPNVIWEKPGPVLDLALADELVEPALEAWEKAISALLEAVGWGEENTASRRFPGGLSLAFSAPMDALYAACEMNEWAWAHAEAEIFGDALPDLGEATERFRAEIKQESNPPLLRLQKAAARRGALFLSCDDHVSIGAGRYSKSWSVKELPEAGEVPWDELQRIPTAMITGTNGKTTTVRLLRAMVMADGLVPGMSSTDWLMVGDRVVDKGDWAGPGGARNILRDARVDVALLETARGGMLRRGLGLAAREADVVLLTNIAEDHLGEWGIQDLDMLADTKFTIRHAGKRMVLNADDEKSVERIGLVEVPQTRFSLRADDARLLEHRAAGGHAAWSDGDTLWWDQGEGPQRLIEVADIPIALDGAAQHNVANALAAVCVAKALGLKDSAILAGLRAFRSDAADNPGRLNLFELGGVRVLVDFAHNPHGLDALMTMAKAMQGEGRLLVTVGHAGDRNEEALREVPLTVWKHGVDRVLIKEQEKDLRGREVGEIPAIMKAALKEAGASEDAVDLAADELQAAKQALEWARPGDLLLLQTLSHRNQVLALIQQLGQAGWTPGQAVPISGD